MAGRAQIWLSLTSREGHDFSRAKNNEASAALAAEVRCEAYSADVATKHIFRHLDHMATQEILRCRDLRAELPRFRTRARGWGRVFTDHASAMTTILPHRDYIHQNPASAVWWRTQAIIAFVQPSPDSNCIKRTQRLKPTWLSIRGTTEVVPFPVQKKRHPSDDPFDPSTGSGREETCR
jgi:hypothetical protein